MVFSSLTFLQLYLPICLLLYYLVPQKGRNAVLFFMSLVFYAWGEPVYVVLLLFSTVLDYTCGKLGDKYRGKPAAKAALIVSVCVNLGLLSIFKYSGLVVEMINRIAGTAIAVPELALPIGISFYTFQTMSYTIDIYRGEAKPQKNMLDFGTYVTLFPQLVAGPIVRYQTVAEELHHRTCSVDLFADGVRRFLCGFGKKILLANNIGLLWETVSAQTAPTVLLAWLGVLAYGFQIYFDFSGYSDMAIGLGLMLGFHFPENFRYPFMADSITDFWRRWHITMGTWFRDYVYIPLGGNKKGRRRQLCNIAIVWLLTGLWHGASWNFVLWGAYFGGLLLLEKLFLLRLLDKLPGWLHHVYAMLCVTIGWTLFAFENMKVGMNWLKHMFRGQLYDQNSLYLLMTYGVLLLVCAIASTPAMKYLKGFCKKKNAGGTFAVEGIGFFFLMAACVAYLISGSYNPFLYFRF